MCASSVVSDYYMLTYPDRIGLGQPNQWGSPAQIIQTMDPEAKELLRRAMELLDRVDKKLGDIECMDEKKAAFLNALTPNEI